MNNKKVFCSVALFFCISLHAFAQEEPAPPAEPAKASLEEQNKKLLQEEEELLKRAQGLQKNSETVKSDPPASPVPSPDKVPVSQTGPEKPNKEESRAQKKLNQVCGCTPEALAASQDKLKTVTSELEDMRNKLLLSETEVDRLAKIVDERIKPRANASIESLSNESNKGVDIRPRVARDLPIATVMALKAELRSEPQESASILSTVSQGTRLAIETRSGGWYRVIAPNGVRAWVSSQVINFGEKPGPNSAARSKALTEGF